MQSADQLGGEGGGELVGHPGWEVALGVGVGHVAKLAAQVRSQGSDREACKSQNGKKKIILRSNGENLTCISGG